MKKLFFSSALVLLLSCSDQKEKKADVIPVKEFTHLLAEYHITERLATEYDYDYDSNKVAFFSYYYPELLAKHKVSREAFESSFYYYAKDPKGFKKIYEDIQIILKEKSDSLTKK